MTVSIEVPEPPADKKIVPGLNDTVGPPGAIGETVAESDTVPENAALFRVKTEEPNEPATRPTLVERAEI